MSLVSLMSGMSLLVCFVEESRGEEGKYMSSKERSAPWERVGYQVYKAFFSYP